MTERAWPVNRARAWLALNEHVLREDPVAQEEDFRRLLSHLGYYQEDINRAVAEVYGEASTEAVVRIEIAPAEDGDEFGLLSEARAELRRMIKDGLVTKELQFCSGAVRITREGFDV